MSIHEQKQVIVMRTDLNMRKGKMIAQGAHAAVMATFNAGQLDDRVLRWLMYGMKKITVQVGSEAELMEIADKALAAGLHCELVRDAGLTEFKEPTYTCCAIGPNKSEDIDKITGELKLL